MATTADRLRMALNDKNMKQSELSEITGIGKSSISTYLSGEYLPKQRNIYKMAKALDVDEAWLMGEDVPKERRSRTAAPPHPALRPFPATHKVPRLGTIACGEPILATENHEAYDDVPEFVHCDFTLVCKGDSMINARILDGDTVCIRQQSTVENGEIAAVLIDDEATLKRVYLKPDRITLMAENSAYEPIIYSGEEMNQCRILGKAVYFISRLDR